MGSKNEWDSCLPIPELKSGVSVCVIGMLAVLSFHSSVLGGFVFDDSEAVVNNQDVRIATPLYNIFRNDFWGTRITHNASHKSYRPLTTLSFRLNVLASGGVLNATQFHAVNLILYVLVCCLSLFVFKSICAEVSCQRVAIVAAILFTVHPVHVESVAPVVGRADILSALFMFSAFMTHSCSWKQKTISRNVMCTLLTVVFAAISMFAKEQGITILAICSAYDLLILRKLHPKKLLARKTWSKIGTRKLLTRQAVLFLAAGLLLALRWWVMGGTVPVFQKVDNPASFLDSMHLRVINYIYIYALNVWLLLCPEWLCFDWSMGCVPLILSPYDVRIFIVIVFPIIFGLLAFSSMKNASGESRRILMALIFTVVPFLPASNMFFRVGFVIAERTLLVPSLGFCLIIALGYRELSSRKIWKLISAPALVCVVSVFCLRTHFRTLQWRTESDLFLSALSVCPLNAKVHYNLAKTSANYTLAMKHYKDALRLNMEYDQAMNNLANILKDIGELSEAEQLLRKALQLRPDFAAAWMNLGIVLSNKKDFTAAEECYRNAIKHRRKYPDCFYNLGNLFLELKDHVKAYESWRQAVLLDPRHQAAWNNLIIMLDSIGNHKEALKVGQEALAALPNSSAIHFNIANSLGKAGDFSTAEKHFKSAIKLNPRYALYYVNLGVLYHHWKKFGQAREMYLQALSLDSNLKSAKENLRLLKNLTL